jgi:hypothetical protein
MMGFNWNRIADLNLLKNELLPGKLKDNGGEAPDRGWGLEPMIEKGKAGADQAESVLE